MKQRYKLGEAEEFKLWTLLENNDRVGMIEFANFVYNNCFWQVEHLKDFVDYLNDPETTDYYSLNAIAKKLHIYINGKYNLPEEKRRRYA